jgi:hypothetical protein
MFRRFLRLEAAPDSQILKFVWRYGPLPLRDSLPRSQPIADWRKYSRLGNA